MSDSPEDRFAQSLFVKRAAAAAESEEEEPQSVESVEEPDPEETVDPSGSGTAYAPLSKRNLFEHHDVHPVVLSLVLLDRYGYSWLDWEPETLWTEIKDDFDQATISVHTRNKIQAVKTCHLVDTPWDAWETFYVVCQAFNNNVPNFRILDAPSTAQMMNAVQTMSHIADHKFSDDVAKFVACCALEEGVFFLPKPLDFAQEWASRPQYRCKECGRIDRDDENNECDHCGAPQASLVKEFARDPRPVKVRYEECIRKGDDRDELQETVVDVQVARLLVARDYMLQRERDLIEQAEAVRDGKKVPSQPSTI